MLDLRALSECKLPPFGSELKWITAIEKILLVRHKTKTSVHLIGDICGIGLVANRLQSKINNYILSLIGLILVYSSF